MRIGRITHLMGLAGFLLWGAVIVLRSTAATGVPALGFFLGILPNFGAVWAGAAFIVSCWKPLLRREFPWPRYGLLIVCVLALLLLSEILHALFLDAFFDPWDMAASLVAAGILYAVYRRGYT